MISTEVFFPADEESSRYGSSASGSPSTPWPTGSRTAVGRAVGGRSSAPAHAPLTTPKTFGPTTRRSTTPEGNSRGPETPPTRRTRRHHCGCGVALPRRRPAGGAAAARQRHNTATNLPLDLLGGPTAVTASASGLDDATTRFDRNEPQLNVSTGPDDERDTTTPAAIVESMRAVPLAGALQPAGRERLTTSLVANTTGDATIRAGVPVGWLIGDRTGTGAQGERNDVGIVLPPDRAPLVSPSTPTRPTRSPRPATPPSPRRQRSRYGGSSVNSRHTTLGKERSWDT